MRMILFSLCTVNVIVCCAPVGHVHAASLKAAHSYSWRSNVICWWLFIVGIREEECSMTLKSCEIVTLGFGRCLVGFFVLVFWFFLKLHFWTKCSAGSSVFAGSSAVPSHICGMVKGKALTVLTSFRYYISFISCIYGESVLKSSRTGIGMTTFYSVCNT